MKQLLDFEYYDALCDIWEDDIDVCGDVIHGKSSDSLGDVFKSIASIESDLDDYILYDKCCELMSWGKGIALHENIKEKSVAETLKYIANKYYLRLLDENIDNIIYNICVTHINDTLIKNENISYSKNDLEEFLRENCFDSCCSKDQIIETLTNDILNKN